MKSLSCPVCYRRFKNEGGMKGHLLSLKDAAHLAWRTQIRPAAPVPASQPRAYPPVQPSTPLLFNPSEGSPIPVPLPGLDPRPVSPQNPGGTPNPTPPAKGPPEGYPGGAAPGAPLEGVKVFEIPAAAQIGPLLPDTGPIIPPAPPTANEDGSLDVPLEPFIAGSVALMVNGFILREPGDGKLRPEEVTESGFPKAAEACVKLYFPTLPLNHPLVALFVSGAGLASAIAAKKAPKKKPGKHDDDAAEEAEPPRSPTSPKVESSSTGDAYWDSILAQAGGHRRGGAADDD